MLLTYREHVDVGRLEQFFGNDGSKKTAAISFEGPLPYTVTAASKDIGKAKTLLTGGAGWAGTRRDLPQTVDVTFSAGTVDEPGAGSSSHGFPW